MSSAHPHQSIGQSAVMCPFAFATYWLPVIRTAGWRESWVSCSPHHANRRFVSVS